MRYVAAYVLAVMGGNSSPNADDIRAIVSSVGIDVDESKLSKVIRELQGKDIEELISQGSERLATAFAGGVGISSEVKGDGEQTNEPDAKENPKEAEKEESEGSEDEDFGMGLFDM